MDSIVKNILAQIFRQRTTAEEKANLFWHATHNTKICCGEDYAAFIDGSGGG